MKPLRERIGAAFDFTDPAPVNMRRISVLLIARDFTAMASNALRHVEVESILLVRAQFVRLWNGAPVGSCSARRSIRNQKERIMLTAAL
jgi:hypothetical protein